MNTLTFGRKAIFICGPCGAGKSTHSLFLSSFFSVPFLEGDLFHPQSSVQKLSSGIPLTDEDRIPWLQSIADEVFRRNAPVVLISCSNLKRKYRQFFFDYFSERLKPYFVFLYGNRDIIFQRLEARSDHFMGAKMLDSQLLIQEIPFDEHNSFCVCVDGKIEDIQDTLTMIFKEVLTN